VVAKLDPTIWKCNHDLGASLIIKHKVKICTLHTLISKQTYIIRHREGGGFVQVLIKARRDL
jgi:hypothetical protein